MAIYELYETLNANELQSKGNFDRVEPLNGKPSAETEGFTSKKSDLVTQKSDNGHLDDPIIAESPNLYKQTGGFVSKIPYFFETPVPKYFRENGWFKNENTWKYIIWAFSKCQTQSHKVIIENKEITLAPYEFISGRITSSKECFLTENIFRNQQKMLLNAGFLKKSTNSKTNHYSCYIWVTERFNKFDNQQNDQPITNHAPTVNHKSEDKKIRYKEDHPLTPSFQKNESHLMIDDLFSKEENKIKIHEGKYANKTPFTVYLTQNHLEECLKSRGSLERIKEIIDQVASWPGRQFEIKDWFKTIKEWKFKNVVANRTSENEELGKKIDDLYSSSPGWSARMYRDSKKDQRGILFEGHGAYSEPLFVSFSEINFKEKCIEIINTKKMTKKVMK